MKLQYSLLAATALCIALPRDLQKRQIESSQMGQSTDSFGSAPATSGDQASSGFDSGTSSQPEPMVTAGNDEGLQQPATFPETTPETFDSSLGSSSQEFPPSADPMMMGAADNQMATDVSLDPSTFADPMNPMDSEMVESQFTDDFGAVTGKAGKAKKSTKKTSKKTAKKATNKSSKKGTRKKGSTNPKKTNAAAKPKATKKPTRKVAAPLPHA